MKKSSLIKSITGIPKSKMKKYLLYLIYLLALSSFSCRNDYEIKIEWSVLYDTSGNDFEKTRVMLDFTNGSGDITFHLTPYKTTKIRLAKDMRLYGSGGEFIYAMYIYPDKYANGINGKEQDRFKKHGVMEIFLYNPRITDKTENSITIPPHENVLAYHYSVSQNNVMYKIFSKNNRIRTAIDEITEISSPVNLEDILNIMEENNLDECYFSMLYPSSPAGYWDDFTAYVVRSNLDNKPLLLPSFNLFP